MSRPSASPRPPAPWPVAVAALQLPTLVIDAVQRAVVDAGFTDVTPLQGFAFARIAAGDATTGDLAEHLGVSKQAAAQLAQRLVEGGYVTRHPHPADRRARLLALTDRGTACMRAARGGAEHLVGEWRAQLGPGPAARFESGLQALVASAPALRPPL